jgi:hypothetical protein
MLKEWQFQAASPASAPGGGLVAEISRAPAEGLRKGLQGLTIVVTTRRYAVGQGQPVQRGLCSMAQVFGGHCTHMSQHTVTV